MAANVENMFSVRLVPWHGLGTIVQDAPTSDNAIRIAGLDWSVIQKPIFYKQNGIDTVIPGFKANVRDKDGKTLGMVTDKYKIVQNSEAFAFTDELLGEGVTYETAGSLASGRRVWLLAKLEGTKLITDEKFDQYLCFTNTHDGTGAVRVAITPVRVVCQNTLNLALQTAQRQWSCAHKGDIQSKLDDARNTLLNAHKYMAELEEHFGELKLKKLTDDKVRSYIELLLPYDEGDAERKIKNIEEMREELMVRYLHAPDLQPIEKSAYRFINAVSDFATHKEPLRNTKNFRENMFMRTIDGNALIDLAARIVKSA